MKNIIIAVLLASGSLVAAESVSANKSGASTGVDGAKFYKKRCSVCHGENGQKTPMKGMIPIASMDATSLARKVRAYREQEDRHGAYAIYEDSQVMREATYSISDQQISAIATYISGLVAAESVPAAKSGASTGVDGAKFYKKRCSVCHGENGQKTPMKGMIPIASMDATSLARKVRAYRDQEERHGAYAIYEDSQVMREATYSISDQQISAIATYISGLK